MTPRRVQVGAPRAAPRLLSLRTDPLEKPQRVPAAQHGADPVGHRGRLLRISPTLPARGYLEELEEEIARVRQSHGVASGGRPGPGGRPAGPVG
jgi:hypothetical protein